MLPTKGTCKFYPVYPYVHHSPLATGDMSQVTPAAAALPLWWFGITRNTRRRYGRARTVSVSKKPSATIAYGTPSGRHIQK